MPPLSTQWLFLNGVVLRQLYSVCCYSCGILYLWPFSASCVVQLLAIQLLCGGHSPGIECYQLQCVCVCVCVLCNVHVHMVHTALVTRTLL